MEVSTVQEVEPFDDADEERAKAERARAVTRSLDVFDRLVWAKTLWADAGKRVTHQWEGYLHGREVGYVMFDLQTRAFRAYVLVARATPTSWSKYDQVGEFRLSTDAKRAVMYEVTAFPRALGEAFAVFTPRARPEEAEEEEAHGTGAVLLFGK